MNNYPPDWYEVTLCSVPLPWPFSWSAHTYFLLSYHGVNDRYEVWGQERGSELRQSFLYKNLYADHTIGGRRSLFDSAIEPKHFFRGQTIGICSGDGSSVARTLYDLVVGSGKTYPWKDRYRLLPGPNSNTYTQWVLTQLPEAGLKLPWNAFGKGYANNAKIVT